MDEDWIIYNEGSLDIKPDENLVKIITLQVMD